MTIFNIIITVAWILLLCFWLVSSFRAKKSVRDHVWQSGIGIRLSVVVLVILLFEIPQFQSFAFDYHSFFLNPAVQVIGTVICLLGMSFAVWARVHLGTNWGMPMSRRERPELVTSGPYRLVRHPIYTGMLFAILGTALVSGLGWLVVFVILLAYFSYAAKKEERLMAELFPNDYPAYKKRTKMLVPFLF